MGKTGRLNLEMNDWMGNQNKKREKLTDSDILKQFEQAEKDTRFLPINPPPKDEFDQILNADSFARQGFSKVLKEEDLSDKALSTAVFDLYKNRETYINAMEKSSLSNAVETITSLIESCVSHS